MEKCIDSAMNDVPDSVGITPVVNPLFEEPNLIGAGTKGNITELGQSLSESASGPRTLAQNESTKATNFGSLVDITNQVQPENISPDPRVVSDPKSAAAPVASARARGEKAVMGARKSLGKNPNSGSGAVRNVGAGPIVRAASSGTRPAPYVQRVAQVFQQEFANVKAQPPDAVKGEQCKSLLVGRVVLKA